MTILSTDTITGETFIITVDPAWYSTAERAALKAGKAIRNTFAPRILHRLA